MLDRQDWRGERFLLLQGPLGPYFARLARALEQRGAEVHKINFNGGDQVFSPGGTPYTGTLADWASCFTEHVVRHRITTVALFGDRRPIHDSIADLCRAQGIRCYVFEEGYFRPAYITCELGGVNARSGIPRDAAFYRAQAEQEPVREMQPPRHAYWAMVLWTCIYYFFSALLWPRYRHYRHHRPLRLSESLRWLRGSARKWWRKWAERGVEAQLAGPLSGRFFLVPLQVHNDAQVIHNSRFGSVEAFIKEVVSSFARGARGEQWLVFKHHPMDRAYCNHARLLRQLGRAFGIEDRLVYIHDQHLPTLLDHAAGVVVINSTAGLSALHQGVPTITLGNAFYDFEGLTCRLPLDEFWRSAPACKPDRELYLAYRRWVIRHTQINDNFYAGPLSGPSTINEGGWQPPATKADGAEPGVREQLS